MREGECLLYYTNIIHSHLINLRLNEFEFEFALLLSVLCEI